MRALRSIMVAVALAVASLVLAASAAAAIPGSAFTWTERTPAVSPPARAAGAMAYDAASEEIVLFGGEGGSGPLADTWTWDGEEWTEATPAHSPPARGDAMIAYDAATEEVVLFGGEGGSGPLADTWTWDGEDWTERTPVVSPPARAAGAMAYDAATEEVLLFGGVDSAGELGDTWTWNGTAWIERAPASSPSGREGAAIAYDPPRGEVVLFGGYGLGRYQELDWLDETWTWNGTSWTELTPASSPPAQDAPAMVYDDGAGEVLLAGSGSSETWNWNGSTWAQRTPASSPAPRFFAALAYDAASEEAILFGGQQQQQQLADTWSYHPLGLPTAKILAPADGGSFALGQAVPSSFSCQEGEGGPGIESCVDSNGAAGGGGRLDTSTPGAHTYTVTATSKDGRASSSAIHYTVGSAQPSPTAGSSAAGAATTPTRAPAPVVTITHRPHRGHAGRGHGAPRYVFRFTTETPGATFRCSLDGGPFQGCASPKVYRGLRGGRHVFRVEALDPAGQASSVRKVVFVAAGKRRTGGAR